MIQNDSLKDVWCDGLFYYFPEKWRILLQPELNEHIEKILSNLSNFVISEIKDKPNKIFPEKSQIFSAFDLPPEKIKCVILGQDPYHGRGQANGLAFSVSKQTTIPPSLSNIFKELNSDLKFSYPKNGDLSNWKNEGVLLLNSSLTVEEKKAASHVDKGWEVFTNLVIKCLAKQKKNLVFMLWGKKAKEKIVFINEEKHLIIESTHPSPYSAFGGQSNDQSFFGSKPFSRANKYLIENNIAPIYWELPPEEKVRK